ncbi:DUF805 domain-containing protein [Protaetiibacter intestinalis]|uniref:DUF805 domain-containing protein n=1 Tax=Protaetiibacter intestinalis TaxID=2419774 RepID=A0A387BKV4_9MICO|nr:DUF805 domain-containing protein [Protaetiibacter intestinalis]AYF99140.1 DUF805 domain-containing protein [Protaetiibacter intestinalis]
MSDQTTSAPPGWYPDAQVPGGERWWDGIGWTDFRRTASTVPPAVVASYASPYGYASATTLPGGPVPLWAPLYGATMGQAWQRFWKKYADFTGRASRSEFWFAYLWIMILVFGTYLLLGIAGGVLGAVTASNGYSSGSGAFGVVYGLVSLVLIVGWIGMFIPYLAVAVRRLHDAGYPGTYLLFSLIPFVGGILMIVFLVSESKPSGAIYDRPTS